MKERTKMQITRKSQHITVEQYSLVFEWLDTPGAGFSFPCTKQGEVIKEGMTPGALENLNKCQSGAYEVKPMGVRDETYTYFMHAAGKCSCGRTVELATFTNTCACGLEYNSCGQLLAPRYCW